MKIHIISCDTGRVIYSTDIFLQGQNYDPTDEEHFALAWRAAVEDRVVKDEDKAKYTFEKSAN